MLIADGDKCYLSSHDMQSVSVSDNTPRCSRCNSSSLLKKRKFPASHTAESSQQLTNLSAGTQSESAVESMFTEEQLGGLL
ncbi:hypothetical protein BaRGS_00012821 [Batillaria attramentaria]|uniref:Uncharacterized protein n=1 Tax=Batillaria attramentaria TaxID=370345 RepID=A0ABD0L977_9CAEN